MGNRRAAPKRARPASTSFAIATVTRNPHRFDRWLEYYRSLGAAHVFLAVEKTPAVVAYCVAHADFVTVSETSPERNPYDSIIDRQVIHVDKALAACAQRGIGWLFHVDDDELLHFVEPWESIVHQVRCAPAARAQTAPHGTFDATLGSPTLLVKCCRTTHISIYLSIFIIYPCIHPSIYIYVYVYITPHYVYIYIAPQHGTFGDAGLTHTPRGMLSHDAIYIYIYLYIYIMIYPSIHPSIYITAQHGTFDATPGSPTHHGD